MGIGYTTETRLISGVKEFLKQTTFLVTSFIFIVTVDAVFTFGTEMVSSLSESQSKGLSQGSSPFSLADD